MISRTSKLLMMVCAIGLLGSVWAVPASAQDKDKTEKPTMYTYVAEWDVPRAQWPDIEKIYVGGKDTMDKLVADGTIVGYGYYITVVHQVDQSTHGSWFQAMSMANLMKALAAVKASSAGAPVLSASKHWDLVFETKLYGYHSGTFEGSYLRVSTWTVKPGMGETVEKFEKQYMVPILDKLLADGAIHGYQIDDQSIHTENPYTFDMAILTNGAEGIDKFYAALDEADKTDGLAVPAFAQSIDYSLHRDYLALVPSFTHK